MENFEQKKALVAVLALLIAVLIAGFLFYQWNINKLDQGTIIETGRENTIKDTQEKQTEMEKFLKEQEEKYQNLTEEEKQKTKELSDDFLEEQEKKSENLTAEEKEKQEELMMTFLEEQEEKYQASQE